MNIYGNREPQKAFLVIDMLNDFVLEGAPLRVPGAVRIMDALRKRLVSARSEGVPVIYICDDHEPQDREFDLWPPHALAGTKGAQIVEALTPEAGDMVVTKRRYSGFYQSRLDETLMRLGADHLLVTGILTNICVLYTVADARARDYGVTVFSDAVASTDPDAHRFALQQMAQVLGAHVV